MSDFVSADSPDQQKCAMFCHPIPICVTATTITPAIVVAVERWVKGPMSERLHIITMPSDGPLWVGHHVHAAV